MQTHTQEKNLFRNKENAILPSTRRKKKNISTQSNQNYYPIITAF